MTGQLLYKPIGSSLNKEILEKSFKNNKERICIAFSYTKEDTKYWDNCTFEKLQDLESDGVFSKIINTENECIVYFHGACGVKENELPFYTVQNKKDWFWFAIEGISPTFPTSYEGECFYSNFLYNISPNGAYNLWHKLASESKLSRTIGIKYGVVSKFGQWHEENGLFFSNLDHKKVPYQSQHWNSSNNTQKPKENIGLKYPEVDRIDEGLLVGKSGVGLLNYYNLHNTNPNMNYIDDITNQKYKDLGFRPLDFIMSIAKKNIIYPTPSIELIKEYLASGEEVAVSIIRFVDCDKNNRIELTITIPGKNNSKDKDTLLTQQRAYIIRNLNVRIVMTENHVDEAEAVDLIKSGLGNESQKELENMPDSQLISRATELGLKDWHLIQS